MNLRRSGFAHSAYGPFIENKERIQKYKETCDSGYIYQNEPDRACFQYDMAYGDFKNLTRITVSDKKFCNEIFNIAKNPKYDRYQWGLALMSYKFFDKRTSGSGIKNQNMSDQHPSNVGRVAMVSERMQQLVKKLWKPIIKKFKRRKVRSPFIDNISDRNPIKK